MSLIDASVFFDDEIDDGVAVAAAVVAAGAAEVAADFDAAAVIGAGEVEDGCLRRPCLESALLCRFGVLAPDFVCRRRFDVAGVEAPEPGKDADVRLLLPVNGMQLPDCACPMSSSSDPDALDFRDGICFPTFSILRNSVTRCYSYRQTLLVSMF